MSRAKVPGGDWMPFWPIAEAAGIKRKPDALFCNGYVAGWRLKNGEYVIVAPSEQPEMAADLEIEVEWLRKEMKQ